jgi:hypothetical protein
MTNSPEQGQRVVWGVALTAQTVAVVVSALVVALLIGLAVLSWLEHVR